MSILVGETRVRLHPLMLMFPVMAALLGVGEEAAALLIGLTVHEAAHLLAARGMGVRVEQLRLMPFGGAMSVGNPYALSPAQLLVVAAAGPAASLALVFACAALAHWGALSVGTALAMLRVNLELLLFNLLPALPLDGGRMLYALLFSRVGRARAAEAGIWLGRVVAAGLLALAVWTWAAQGRFNLSLAFAAVFILASAPEERRALSDTRVQTLLNELQPLSGPVPARLWAVNDRCPVQTALRAARPDALTLYAVYAGDRLTAIVDDRQLLGAALAHSGNATVAEARRSS